MLLNYPAQANPPVDKVSIPAHTHAPFGLSRKDIVVAFVTLPVLIAAGLATQLTINALFPHLSHRGEDVSTGVLSGLLAIIFFVISRHSRMGLLEEALL